jgi:NAD(P)-dependent dehydrogenase (short-subunit alcohol dehydrogenase family)
MRVIRDKVALVTGAGSGLGRAIALRLTREGAAIHLADVNRAASAGTALQIRALGGQSAVTICDLAEPAAINSLVADVHQRWGGLDILINNAGIGWYGPTQKMTDAEWDRLMAINLEAPIRLTRRLLKTLLARPEAHVVNMASVCGIVCSARFAAYHVSKFGLVGFSEALRAEFNRHGLGVTAVCPGPVLTELYKNAGCAYADRETPRPPAWLCTTAERVAAKTVRAIYRNQAVTLVGGVAHLLYYSKRFAPGIFFALHGVGRAKNMQRKQGTLLQRLTAAAEQKVEHSETEKKAA